MRRPQRGVARRTKPLKCWESTLGYLPLLRSASGVLLGSAAWLDTLTTHYAAALRLDGAYRTTSDAPAQQHRPPRGGEYRLFWRLRTPRHAAGASEGVRWPHLGFSLGNRPSGFYEDANLSPRRCKRTQPDPLRPKAHLATFKSVSGLLCLRAGSNKDAKLPPKVVKFNRKFDYQGSAPLKHTSDQSTSLPLSFPLVAFANKSSRDDPSWGSEA